MRKLGECSTWNIIGIIGFGGIVPRRTLWKKLWIGEGRNQENYCRGCVADVYYFGYVRSCVPHNL
jgi:hypothetical protein